MVIVIMRDYDSNSDGDGTAEDVETFSTLNDACLLLVW